MKRIAFVLVAGAFACAQPVHLSADHGRSTREAFSRQAVRPPGAKEARPVSGLDSQEASIIAEAYLKSLVPKGGKVEDESVLYVAPTPGVGRGRPALPLPSVPAGEGK